VDSEEATGLGVMGEECFAKAARSRLSGSEISTLLGGDFKKTSATWLNVI
jgi:hypothetical protein